MSYAVNSATPANHSLRQLASKRFRSNRRSPKLASVSQRLTYEKLTRLIESGEYQFESTACPCAVPADDITVSEVDRYGLPLNSKLCTACGTVRIDPYLTPASLADFYSNIYQNLYGRGLDQEAYFDRQITYGRKVQKSVFHQLPKTVLEIGCGAGGGLSVFAQSGASVVGCDYSKSLIEFGKNRGLNDLFVGSIDDLPQRHHETPYDLILLHHVMEHIVAPLDLLKQLARLLSSNGRVIVIVPDLLGIHNHKVPNGDALQYFHIAHKYNFTFEGFGEIAAQAGLACARVHPPADMPTPWSRAAELWATFARQENIATDANLYTADLTNCSKGSEVLKYLRKTEHLHKFRSLRVNVKRIFKSILSRT